VDQPLQRARVIMLVPLHFQSSPPAEGPRDAIHLLLDCHRRILTFCDLALKVARLTHLSVAERAGAAARVERYFTVALPRHVEDEEVLLAHRLWEAGPPSTAVVVALEDMSGQHWEIEALLKSLVPRWRLLGEAPERHGELARELERDSVRLAGLMETHLWLEELVLFPEARARLSPESMESLGAEMRARRGMKP
jgi:hemerythrin-like domain-containing protein